MFQLYQGGSLDPELTSGKIVGGRTLYRWMQIDLKLVDVMWTFPYSAYAADKINTRQIGSALTTIYGMYTKAMAILSMKMNSM